MDIKQLKNKALQMQSNFKDGYIELMDNVKEKHIKNVQDNTPVDSGDLQESISGEVVNDTIQYGSDSEYALFVEEGHLSRSGKFVEGAHMFGNAEKGLDKILDKEVNKLFDEIDRSW